MIYPGILLRTIIRIPTPKLRSSMISAGCLTRPSLKMLNISDRPIFKDLFNEDLKYLQKICERNKMEVRMAGGPVRDILMNIVPHDLDFATTAMPEEMTKIFNEEGVRIIEYGPRAVEHGTVTVRINDKVNYEITTTRSDVLCYGRHAKVEFHKDWEADANRRDLTINAMFLDLNGTVYDYFNGISDLENKQIRFVGDADARIKEDYLRILRYFRFYGRIKADPEDHDSKTLEIIKSNAEGLRGVAGERILVELKKIVQGHFADHQIRHMIELGVAENIGFPPNCDYAKFESVYNEALKKDYKISEMALLASLLSSSDEVDELHKRLRLSKQEYTTMLFIVEYREKFRCDDEGGLEYYQDLVIDSSDKLNALQRCVQLAAYMNDEKLYSSLTSWQIPKFPFSAKVFVDAGMTKGKRFAESVEKVKSVWKKSRYTATEEQLKEIALSMVNGNK